ncbi:MAG: hypothetical protein P1U63_00370 [Coxiellaceae bacterium]|nr:hypothetical protein [Coxiellaceae bacterium]
MSRRRVTRNLDGTRTVVEIDQDGKEFEVPSEEKLARNTPSDPRVRVTTYPIDDDGSRPARGTTASQFATSSPRPNVYSRQRPPTPPPRSSSYTHPLFARRTEPNPTTSNDPFAGVPFTPDSPSSTLSIVSDDSAATSSVDSSGPADEKDYEDKPGGIDLPRPNR